MPRGIYQRSPRGKYRINPLSFTEQDFIKEHHEKIAVTEFALLLNRNVEVIKTYMNREGLKQKHVVPEPPKKSIQEQKKLFDRSAFTTYSNRQFV